MSIGHHGRWENVPTWKKAVILIVGLAILYLVTFKYL